MNFLSHAEVVIQEHVKQAHKDSCIHEGLFADGRGLDVTKRCYQCGGDIPNRDL